MYSEIEELRKFSTGTITKARLAKLVVALSNARKLFVRLEPKPGDDDAAVDFETANTGLEDVLNDLESACDDLESAEDKDAREDAQEEIANGLEDALRCFDEIMPVAVVGDGAYAKLIEECEAIIKEVDSLPDESRSVRLSEWLDSVPAGTEREKRMCLLVEIVKKREQ